VHDLKKLSDGHTRAVQGIVCMRFTHHSFYAGGRHVYSLLLQLYGFVSFYTQLLTGYLLAIAFAS
jgi:hypothetical protein